MADVTKILFRRGTNEERLSANSVGVFLSMGEPGFTIDTKRLYVGDGATKGGIPVGVRNLGAVNVLFGTYANSGYTQQAYSLLVSGVEVGDIIYDRSTKTLWTLTGRANFPPLTSELIKYDFSIGIDPLIFRYNALDQLTIKDESIIPKYISSSIAGGGLTKQAATDPIRIANKGVENYNLADMPAYTVKLNDKDVTAEPVNLFCGPKQFIGRTATSTLTAVDFTTILAQATIQGQNGIGIIQPNATSSVFKLSTEIFDIQTVGINQYTLKLKPPTAIDSSLSVLNRTVTDTLAVSSTSQFVGKVGFNSDINTKNQRINAGTADLSGGKVTCGIITIDPDIPGGGSGANISASSPGMDINTGNGNINTGSGDITTDVVTCNQVSIGTSGVILNSAGLTAPGLANITASSLTVNGIATVNELRSLGDVIAFFASDARLKDNVVELENSLTKIDGMHGYSFTWSDNPVNITQNREGDDIGLIAQEVASVIPRAVQRRNDGYFGVDYVKVIPFLVSCIKELKAEITELKHEVQRLSK